ncbi:MAG: transglutaminase domain-containing protein [Bacteroidales bacterium]|nr:transglutaminase domain-containing protein [Bacteroidales bacterium]
MKKTVFFLFVVLLSITGFGQKQNLSKETQQYLNFLYEYMPLSDRVDYDTSFFVRQVKYALKARETFSWGKKIPEDIFKHFVLVYRVNNENLDTARVVMYNALKERVKGLSMYDATLEVNHWCHEKVNYKASDGRTSSPLATMRTSWGRCGEESTFTVTALRSVGIPARQCYTPRWAHTDDNHAWVEVWIDGTWYYLGACEPEHRLNMAWFTAPAKRAMMVHTTVFGKYNGKEEVNFQTEKYSKINLTEHYAPVKKLCITVKDEKGNIQKDAEVAFGLYNYAEYYPLAKILTNENGVAFLTTGFGDIVVWVKKDKKIAQQHILADETNVVVTLQNEEEFFKQRKNISMLLTPPKELPIETTPEELIKKNNERLVYEDSIRNAYISTFPKTDDELITKSWGNYNEVAKVLRCSHPLKERILQLVYEKDLRDLETSTIMDHLNYIRKTETSEYVINPRIALEKITPWRSFIKKYFDKKQNFTDGNQIAKWIEQNIQLNNKDNYYGVPISPEGVLNYKQADKKSREILSVAICRSFNIQARYEWATGRSQWRENENSVWQYAFKEKELSEQNNCILIVNNDNNNKIKPEYYSQFTIQKYENGEFKTLDYEYDPKFLKFPDTLQLSIGKYRMVVGNRNSNGSVNVTESYFDLTNSKQATTITVTIPANKEDKKVYGTINLPEIKEIKTLGFTDLLECYLLNLSQHENKAIVLAVIDPYKEPSRHLLVDIAKSKEDFDKYEDVVLVLVLDKSLLNADFSISVFPSLPKNTKILLDKDKEIEKLIIKATNLEFQNNYPILVLLEKENIVYLSQGYKISSQEEILKLLK